MNLWFRMLALLWRMRGGEPAAITDEVALGMRVLPTDIDLLGHMNNGRYLSLMDIGRLALMMRTGIGQAARRHGWFPLVRRVSIEYLHPLRPFQRFRLATRALSWDDKWFYLEQRFIAGERVCARAYVQGLLRGPHGNVAPTTILEAVGAPEHEAPADPPPMGGPGES